MAKKAKKRTPEKKPVRTTAQRRAAAKKSWALRRAKAAGQNTSDKLPAVDFGNEPSFIPEAPAFMTKPLVVPSTAVATREGDSLYITISNNGTLIRTEVSYSTLRKLGLDALKLVG